MYDVHGMHLNVVLVDLAEELVAAQAAKPADPAHFLGAAHVGLTRGMAAETQSEL
jgi:hypothetical protein